jgi:hypothetical protein
MTPTFTRALRGLDGFSIKPNGWGGYHLHKAGGLFPLASGDMMYLRRAFASVRNTIA